jgi:hypothetical protein
MKYIGILIWLIGLHWFAGHGVYAGNVSIGMHIGENRHTVNPSPKGAKSYSSPTGGIVAEVSLGELSIVSGAHLQSHGYKQSGFTGGTYREEHLSLDYVIIPLLIRSYLPFLQPNLQIFGSMGASGAFLIQSNYWFQKYDRIPVYNDAQQIVGYELANERAFDGPIDYDLSKFVFLLSSQVGISVQVGQGNQMFLQLSGDKNVGSFMRHSPWRLHSWGLSVGYSKSFFWHNE